MLYIKTWRHNKPLPELGRQGTFFFLSSSFFLPWRQLTTLTPTMKRQQRRPPPWSIITTAISFFDSPNPDCVFDFPSSSSISIHYSSNGAICQGRRRRRERREKQLDCVIMNKLYMAAASSVYINQEPTIYCFVFFLCFFLRGGGLLALF